MSQKTLDEIKEILSVQGLKVTHQRLVIYHALEEEKNHPSAEVVFEKLRKTNPSISLGTVYKTLETFVQKGIINRVNTSEGSMRYDALTENHNHIYCTNTKEIIDFSDEELEAVLINFLKKKSISNFNLKDVKLQITGEKINPLKDVGIN
jgi:Fur family peroxide stress response transcriptional regulator